MNLCIYSDFGLHEYNKLIILICVAQSGKKGKSGEGLLQWDSEREMVLQALLQLLQLDIRSLWSLSLVEEEFIRYSAVRRALCGIIKCLD